MGEGKGRGRGKGEGEEEGRGRRDDTIIVCITCTQLNYMHTCSHILSCCRDLLFGNIYDTFSGEDNLSKAVFLEQLCEYITDGKIRSMRTVVVKDFIGE